MHALPEAVADTATEAGGKEREGVRAATVIAALIFLWLAVAVAVGVYDYVTQEPGGPNGMYDGLSDSEAVAYGVTNVIILVGAPALWVMGRSGYRTNAKGALAAIGFRDLRTSWPHAGWILAAKVAAVAAFIGLATLGLRASGIHAEEGTNANLGDLSMLGIVAISMAAGVSEEAMFRGFLMPRIGLVPQAVLFGLVHIGGGSLEQVALATIGGVVYGLGARLAGSIWPGILVHVAWDVGAFTLAKGGA